MDTIKLAVAVIVTVVTMISCSGCGASLGQNAFGTTGFMQEHNNKLKIVQHDREIRGS